MACDHKRWVYSGAVWDEDELGWVQPDPMQVFTYEDVDTGRFRCTQCKTVFYYTGLWKRFYENGEACSGSQEIKRPYMTNPEFCEHLRWARSTNEYIAIHSHYGDKTAARSLVPLINHIHEGIAVLYGWSTGPGKDQFDLRLATRGYCLHPLYQADFELKGAGWGHAAHFAPHGAHSIILAMEYRARANAFLSGEVYTANYSDGGPGVVQIRSGVKPDVGPLPEIKAMLVADKVQNYRDFLKYHRISHSRAGELEFYFQAWMKYLGVDFKEYERLGEFIAHCNQLQPESP